MMAARLEDKQPYVQPLEGFSNLQVWRFWASQCVWSCTTLAFISSSWKTIINWILFLWFCLLTPQITTFL
jgi:hypothetical protein